MKNSNAYTIMYAAILGVVCALLLTATAESTKERIEANKEAEKLKNVLVALKVPTQENASSEQLIEVFNNNVQMEVKGEGLEFYYYKPEGSSEPVAVAVAFEGKGLQARIKGFLALEPDMKTIRGITFYEQAETPGLGGRITEEWFVKQFEKKTIVDADGNPGMEIKPGGAKAGINSVDAITAATMTSDKVEYMLNVVIKKIVEVK
ncbi:MAG: FMN-binding protein [Anaerohalosphaera sp.]|nr:FMN-binding protein [Anaerohalosphaera sp.]